MGVLLWIQKLNKCAEAPSYKKHLFPGALIFQQDAHATIKKCQLPQALTQHVVVKCDVAESLGGRRKAH